MALIPDNNLHILTEEETTKWSLSYSATALCGKILYGIGDLGSFITVKEYFLGSDPRHDIPSLASPYPVGEEKACPECMENPDLPMLALKELF